MCLGNISRLHAILTLFLLLCLSCSLPRLDGCLLSPQLCSEAVPISQISMLVYSSLPLPLTRDACLLASLLVTLAKQGPAVMMGAVVLLFPDHQQKTPSERPYSGSVLLPSFFLSLIFEAHTPPAHAQARHCHPPSSASSTIRGSGLGQGG